ncbi:MAG: CAP domain-containing protein [Sulfurovum sp.]|nr:CAP domain-containing protein [Sulfurovum sp.]
MRRIVLLGVISLALIGCGGGGSAQEHFSNNKEEASSNSNLNKQENTVTLDVSSESDTSTNVDSTSEVDSGNITNPYPAPHITDEDKLAYLQAVNQARAEGQDCGKLGQYGIPEKDSNGNYIYDGSNIMPATTPLRWNNKLYAAAYEHSYDLAHSDTASHSGSGTEYDWTGMDMGGQKSSLVDRVRNNDYNFNSLTENISMGTHWDTPQEAVDAWLKSPGHCVALMGPLFTEMGMGHVNKQGARYRNYWTQVLGSSL